MVCVTHAVIKITYTRIPFMKLKLIAAAITATFATGAMAQEVVVKLGHVAPLTGAQAHYGKDNENGAKMAIADLNAKGWTLGGKKVKWELMSEDDGADPKQGTIVAQKLVDAKVAGVIGHLNSGTTIPASKTYSDANVPQITPSATNPKYTQNGYKTAFRNIANDNALGAALAMHATKKLSLKNIAVIDDRTAYGQGVADVFKKTATANGASVVAEQYTNDKATDFRAILTAVKAKNPQAVFYGGMDAQAGVMLKQMKEMGLNVPLMGGDGICTVELMKIGGDAVGKNVVCAEGGEALSNMPGGPAFEKRYKELYKADIQVYAPYVYDAVMAMATAINKAQSTDGGKIIAELQKLSMDGVTGKISFEGSGELKNAAVTLNTYDGGKKTPLAK
jgi:branched-chain amino acid transport system substrate-binding protein